MSQVTVNIPSSLDRKLNELAKADAISIDQFISLAIAEKISAILTVKYLEERAKRGSGEALQKFLDAVPDVPPEEFDRL